MPGVLFVGPTALLEQIVKHTNALLDKKWKTEGKKKLSAAIAALEEKSKTKKVEDSPVDPLQYFIVPITTSPKDFAAKLVGGKEEKKYVEFLNPLIKDYEAKSPVVSNTTLQATFAELRLKKELQKPGYSYIVGLDVLPENVAIKGELCTFTYQAERGEKSIKTATRAALKKGLINVSLLNDEDFVIINEKAQIFLYDVSLGILETNENGAQIKPKKKEVKEEDDDFKGKSSGGSKFFSRGGAESSSEEESDEEEEDSEEESDSDEPEHKTPGKYLVGQGSDSEDSDAETTRTVKSVRSKRLDEVNAVITSLRNLIKVGNWKEIETEFDKLANTYSKAASIIGVPDQFLAILVELEDFAKETNDKKAKLTPAHNKAWTKMKQVLKKHNKPFEAQIEQYRKNPNANKKKAQDDSDVEFDSEEDSEDEKPKKKKEEKKELKPEDVKEQLNEAKAERGKRATDPAKLVEKISSLLPLAIKLKVVDLQVEILVNVIAFQFDIPRITVPIWRSIHQNLSKLLDTLETEGFTLRESDEPEVETSDEKSVSGNLMALVERLDEEYIKGLQATDHHSQEYSMRLQDEASFLELAIRAQNYYEKNGKMKRAARIAARRIERMYYKPEVEGKESIKSLLEKLLNLVYAHGDEKSKTRSIICVIYFNALHGRLNEAQEMLLMSRLQESIFTADVPTQILFNRAMAQMGLCAFRSGLIKQAHGCLTELYLNGRVKELLAQGITNVRHVEKNPEQEKLEKKRQYPPHMHINLELLEVAHLVSAMLLEIPNMAMNSYDPKKKVISRPFRKLLEYHDRQVFSGPPENSRDIIVAASKALAQGDWQKCESLILGLPVWAAVAESDKIKDMVKNKIKEEALRTYLFSYGQHYDSINSKQLCQMFELSDKAVHQVVSKMMFYEELHASWDQSSGCIVTHKGVDVTRLQYLALQFAEKAAQFVENNERMLDTRTGGPGHRDGKSHGHGHGHGHGAPKGDQSQRQHQAKPEGGQRGGQQQRRPHYNKNYNSSSNRGGNRSHRGGRGGQQRQTSADNQ